MTSADGGAEGTGAGGSGVVFMMMMALFPRSAASTAACLAG